MKPITYKQVLDSDGSFTHLELWQGDQHITISLSVVGSHHAGYRWSEIAEVVEKLTKEIKDRLQTEIGEYGRPVKKAAKDTLKA